MNAQMFQEILDTVCGEITLIIERNIWSIGQDNQGWFFQGRSSWGSDYIVFENLNKTWSTEPDLHAPLSVEQAQKIFDIIEGDADIIYKGQIYSIGKAKGGGWGFFSMSSGITLVQNWKEVPPAVDYYVPGETRFQGKQYGDDFWDEDGFVRDQAYYDSIGMGSWNPNKGKKTKKGFVVTGGATGRVNGKVIVNTPKPPKVTVEDITPEYDKFIVDFEDVDTVAEKLGCLRQGYYSLFLKGENGKIAKAWGMFSTVANLDNEIYPIEVKTAVRMPA